MATELRYKKSFQTKKSEAIKDKIIRDVTNLFEQEENYLKPARKCNVYSNN